MEKCNFQLMGKDGYLKCQMGPTLQHANFSNSFEMRCDPEKCIVWQNYLMLSKLTSGK
ncbi:MAG TPA: hypothetical protein VF817_01220 [Patescibacteria group bacterium]